ncbi:MAG: hypothetical protein HQ541_07520 [Mariniphaga sp.]|nr:hypothetical protein [Mariniphaga sp.]
MKQGFFAYSSEPKYCGEFIEEAIKNINRTKTTYLVSWNDLKIGGKFIINPILEKIDKSDYFCADLTGLNDNVLFELGFAIGRDKPIWLLFDTSHIDSLKKFEELSLLISSGYSAYSNSTQIISSFFKAEPYKSTYNFLDDSLKTVTNQNFKEPLLYLKTQIDTNYSQTIHSNLKKNKVIFLLDDAVENKVQPFGWYLERLLTIPSLIAEFSSSSRSGYETQNSKCSLISGIAYGLNLKVLMVSEKPYEVPIDYVDLLKKYSSAEECNQIISEFIKKLKDDYFDLVNKKKRYIVTQRKRSELQKIYFGEFQAEHEEDKIDQYYIETRTIPDFVGKNINIVVGRKGVGKTALLYHMRNELELSKKSHVCTIKPITFDLEGLIYLLENIPERFERSYLIETTWKFLIYTELAISVYKNILNKPPYLVSEDQFKFVDFIEENDDIFIEDISIRLEQQFQNVSFKEFGETIKSFKVRISEILHSDILGKIRNRLNNLFEDNRKIVVLIDNLDKSWKKDSRLEIQSRWILGLLGVTERIVKDFTAFNNQKNKYSFHLTIFLRSDIFKYVLEYSREPDKIEHTRLFLNTPEVLYRIIEERVFKLSDIEVYPEDLWSKFICEEIGGKKIKEYIFERIIPRPRDIIYLFIKSKESAVLKGHSKIERDDVEHGYSEYSKWFLRSVLVEDGITINQMENFLDEFFGSNEIIKKKTIIENMIKSDIPSTSDEKVEKFIDHLSDLSILGREIDGNNYVFDYDLEGSKKIKRLAKKYGSNNYLIHPALKPYLGLFK